MKRDIRSEDIRSFSDDFNSSVENVIAQNAVVQNGINNQSLFQDKQPPSVFHRGGSRKDNQSEVIRKMLDVRII